MINDKIMYLLIGAIAGMYLSKSGMIGRGWKVTKELKNPPVYEKKAKLVT